MSRVPSPTPDGTAGPSALQGQPADPGRAPASLNTTEPNDEERRHRDRFSAWHSEYRREAIVSAYLILGNWTDAEDCAADAFIRLFGCNFDRITNIHAYIMTTVGNLARNMGTRRGRIGGYNKPGPLPSAGRDDSAQPGEHLFADNRIRALHDSLAELGKQVDLTAVLTSAVGAVADVQDRIILRLLHPVLIEEPAPWSSDRIGRLLGMSGDAVLRRYTKTLLSLRSHVENHLRQQGLER